LIKSLLNDNYRNLFTLLQLYIQYFICSLYHNSVFSTRLIQDIHLIVHFYWALKYSHSSSIDSEYIFKMIIICYNKIIVMQEKIINYPKNSILCDFQLLLCAPEIKLHYLSEFRNSLLKSVGYYRGNLGDLFCRTLRHHYTQQV